MTTSDILSGFGSALLSGAVKVVDLTAPLGPETPVIYLPPQFGSNTPSVKVHTISEYDANGPFWAWNWLELGEHTGTHFDAPCHWITGKDHPTTPPTPFRRRISSPRSTSSTARRKWLKTSITC